MRLSFPTRTIGLAAGLLIAAGVHAQELSQAEAEARLAQLKDEISALQASLTRSRERYSEEQRRLRDQDLKIQSAALSLRKVQDRIDKQQANLGQLRNDQREYLARLDQRRDALSRQIVAAYRMGRESRLKLLLNQDSPARVGRMLAYYDYYNAAQVERIGELRTALARLGELQAEIDQALAGLSEEQNRGQEALDALRNRRSERQELLTALEQRIGDDQARLEELAQNQSDLEALIERLADALSDIPAELGKYQHPRDLRGQLKMPVDGRVRHGFGQNRSGGMKWQGWLIGANSGAEVRAVAYGRVAYSDWLRGYGLLMIIDHGDGFMSLYGFNETLMFEPGDWVQPGEVIATVGANPGSDQGLYFELRSNGRAIDPAAWIQRN